MEKSLSFIATKDKKIVGIIFESARFEKYVPIDIEVIEEHRKKGIAKALTITYSSLLFMVDKVGERNYHKHMLMVYK